MEKRSVGELGEEAACILLTKKGYIIRERNWRTRFGEIDIIAYDLDGCLVFIEVKTRKSIEYGYPSEFVNYSKQQKIRKTALMYAGENTLMRFDIIEVYYEPKGNTMHVTGFNHIKDAF